LRVVMKGLGIQPNAETGDLSVHEIRETLSRARRAAFLAGRILLTLDGVLLNWCPIRMMPEVAGKAQCS